MLKMPAIREGPTLARLAAATADSLFRNSGIIISAPPGSGEGSLGGRATATFRQTSPSRRFPQFQGGLFAVKRQ